MTEPNGKGPRVDALVLIYINLRTKIKEIEAAQKEYLKPYEQEKQQVAGLLLAFLKETGQESAKTAEGTVYISRRPTASLADPNVFMDYVKETGEFELLNRAANANACIEHAKTNGGVLPPGVKINTLEGIGVLAS